MPLVVGGVVALLLALALGYWLFSAFSHFQEATDKMEQSQNRLKSLTSRKVFPSEDNIGIMQKQLDIYSSYQGGLFQTMREGQAEAAEITRDRFRQLLEQTLRKLVQTARAKSIALPANFSFGFQKYTAGMPPEQQYLERLSDQLRTIDTLCTILYNAGISELVSVERVIFDEEAEAAPVEEELTRGRRRGRGEPEPEPVKTTDLVRDPDGLFSRERYTLVYRAQDAVTWKILDRLAKASPFAVVTKIEIVNSARPTIVAPQRTEEEGEAAAGAASSWGAPEAARKPAAKKEPILPRELRVVAGQELPRVTLEVDIYRFAQTEPAEEGEENP
jgi:hypothetical protein